METKTCSVYIDNEPFNFEVKGDFFWGENKVLYREKDSVLSNVSWKNKGYSVVKAFTNTEFSDLYESIKLNIIKAIKSANISIDEVAFELEKYHEVVTTNQEHNKVINVTRNLTVDDLDFNIENLTEVFGEFLGCQLTSWIEELQKSHVQIRISRPNSLDINPPHRDGYLSYWEDIINVWIPISGCNEKTSLPVISGSHLIPENEILRTTSKGATINGNVYYVPCILESKKGSFQMERPNPEQGEALLFTPFLIHGAAVNKSNNQTRVALELRFPKIS